MPRTVTFKVSFQLPYGANVNDALNYVASAVTAECCLLRPEEPMHNLERHSISVRRFIEPRETAGQLDENEHHR